MIRRGRASAAALLILAALGLLTTMGPAALASGSDGQGPQTFAGTAGTQLAALAGGTDEVSAQRSARAKRRRSIQLPPARNCARPGRLTFRLRARKLRSAEVFVNGRRVRNLHGRALRRRVRLRGLGSGRVRLKVVAVTQDGRRLRRSRAYRPCPLPAPQALPGCADDSGLPGGVHPGGDWPTYGKDLDNSRSQGAESQINADNAAGLNPAWTFSVAAVGGKGDFVGTPIVKDGCVYVGTVAGWVYAINADTGKMAWRTKLDRGEVNNTVAVDDGLVYVGLTNVTAEPCAGAGCEGPYVVALDQRSGRKVWETDGPIDAQAGSDMYGSPVVFDPTPEDGPDPPTSCFAGVLQVGTPAGLTLDSVRVYVNGRYARKAVRPTEHTRIKVKLPRRGRTIVIRVRGITNGHVQQVRQRYRRCVGKRQRRSSQVQRLTVGDDAIMLVGVSGWAAEGETSLGTDEDRNTFQGSIVLLDATTGHKLEKVYTIHPPSACYTSTCVTGPDDFDAGGSVWSTPAIDPAEKVAYYATGNPFRPENEHKNANAVVKLGVDRTNPAQFAKMLGSGKGTTEGYLPDSQTVPCKDTPTALYACVQLDYDFGASPNLFTDSQGRKLVGAGQKSGIYHVFERGGMQPAWRSLVGAPTPLVGGVVGSTAFDGQRIIGPTTYPPTMWALSPDGGEPIWTTPIETSYHYGQPVAVANGVAYTVDQSGFLNGFATSDGRRVLHRSLSENSQTGDSDVTSQGGVSIARNTVYAAVGNTGLPAGFIIAYRPGATGSPEPDGAPAPPSDGEDEEPSGGETEITAGPGATTTGYLNGFVSISEGGKLAFRNLDSAQHDVTADDEGPEGQPLFRSERIGSQGLALVKGADKLTPGSYGFFCSIHPSMIGTLAVN